MCCIILDSLLLALNLTFMAILLYRINSQKKQDDYDWRRLLRKYGLLNDNEDEIQ